MKCPAKQKLRSGASLNARAGADLLRKQARVAGLPSFALRMMGGHKLNGTATEAAIRYRHD